jgi:hypothetical protein
VSGLLLFVEVENVFENDWVGDFQIAYRDKYWFDRDYRHSGYSSFSCIGSRDMLYRERPKPRFVCFFVLESA